jgi:hypothetical protein
MAMCGYLMLGLPAITWWRFGLWLVIGLILYFTYGFWHSRLHANRQGSNVAMDP